MGKERTIYDPRYQRIVKRLRAARLERGMTQTEAADMLNRPQSFISRCETGTYRIDVLELEVFAQLYGKDLDYFLADEDKGGAE